jgi:hypothetical protein
VETDPLIRRGACAYSRAPLEMSHHHWRDHDDDGEQIFDKIEILELASEISTGPSMLAVACTLFVTCSVLGP